jgi:hypothetical protein
MSHNDTLRVFFSVPEDQLYALKLTPLRATENSGPPLPTHTRAIKIAPGERKGAVVPQMGYYHAHLVSVADRPDTRPVPFFGRCAVMAEVEKGGCLSIASLVTLYPPLEHGGPPDPDMVNPVLIIPGDRRTIYLHDGRWLHLHEIPRCFE